MASLAWKLSTRVARLEKPKPLKNITPNRHSFSDKDYLHQLNSEPVVEIKSPNTPTPSSVEDTLMLLDIVASCILNKDYTNILPLTNSLTNCLKNYGSQLEDHNEEKLDKIFEIIRNGAHETCIDRQSRMNLMHLVELRASQWQMSPAAASYYSLRGGHEPGEMMVGSAGVGEMGFDFSGQGGGPQLLGPGDVIKSSGKYSAPTRVAGKNYCKDEVVIRNSDSGKVMGIKGRRVHMIEELSETVISFQRVNPGAKERLVQITGPSEDKIIYAKNLIEDTIKRNASPIREMTPSGVEGAGSSSSINSCASDENIRQHAASSSGRQPVGGTTKGASSEFKYSVHVLNDVITISSTNLNLLNEAFSLLDSSYASNDEASVLNAPSNPLSVQTVLQTPPASETASSEETCTPTSTGDASQLECDKPPGETHEAVPTLRKDYTIQYSREFLLACSKSKASQMTPADMPTISSLYPGIVRQPTASFDAAAYQKRWLETEGRIASFTTTPDDSD